jgi:DNA-directed RNA polymerase subunit L
MTTIKNIKISDNYIIIPKNSIFSKVQNLLPSDKDVIREKVSFNVINSNPAVVNAIRRTLLNELEILCLNYDIGGKNINDDKFDKYILEDYLNSRINMIPLSYDITKTDQLLKSNIKFEINVVNETPELLYINTDSLVINSAGNSSGNSSGNSAKNEIKFFKGTRLIPLNSNCKLHVKNIHLKLDNTGKSTPVTNFTFKPAELNNEKPIDLNGNSVLDSTLDSSKVEKPIKLISSSVASPKEFYIEFDTMGISGSSLMIYACDSIVNRLNNLSKIGKVSIDKNDERYKFILHNETYTIANIIVQKIYDLDKNVPFVTFEQPHPLKNEIYVILKHTSSEILFNKAIQACIEEFKSISKTF